MKTNVRRPLIIRTTLILLLLIIVLPYELQGEIEGTFAEATCNWMMLPNQGQREYSKAMVVRRFLWHDLFKDHTLPVTRRNVIPR